MSPRLQEEMRPAVLVMRETGKPRVLYFENHYDAFDVAYSLDGKTKWDLYTVEYVRAGEIPDDLKPKPKQGRSGL